MLNLTGNNLEQKAENMKLLGVRLQELGRNLQNLTLNLFDNYLWGNSESLKQI